MPNDFYNKPTDEKPITTIRSAAFNSNNAAVEEGFNILPSELDLKRDQYGVDSSADATLYVVTVPDLTVPYYDGLSITFQTIFENTGAANVTVNGGTNEPIVDGNGNPLVAGSIKAGQIITVIKEPAGFQLVSTVLLQADIQIAVDAAAAASTSETNAAASAAAALVRENNAADNVATALTSGANATFGTVTGAGILSIDDTTQSTSTITGSIHTDGGLGVAKDIFSGGKISTGGESAPDVDAGGICINHGAGDGHATTLKNSDVTHGMTAIWDTDTYATVGKASSTGGGLRLGGQASTGTAIAMFATPTSPSTSDTGVGCFEFYGRKKSGTSITGLTDSEVLVDFSNNATVKVVIKGNGDIVTQGGIKTVGTIATGNEAAPDVDAGGICLNHGAGDGNAMSFKNSDVAHGMTTLDETDTYGSFTKFAAADGGFRIQGYGEVATGFAAEATAITPTTPDTANGVLVFSGSKKSGTTKADIADAENIASFRNNITNKVTIKGNGDIVTQGGLRVNAPIGMKSYTVATLPTVGTAEWVYVSNETGGAIPCFSDGTNWRRCSDRAIAA